MGRRWIIKKVIIFLKYRPFISRTAFPSWSLSDPYIRIMKTTMQMDTIEKEDADNVEYNRPADTRENGEENNTKNKSV